MATLGDRIRELRKDKHITQRELADKLHVAYSTMSQYESGARVPSDEIKKRMADVFGVSVDYLIGRVNTSMQGNTEISKESFSNDIVVLARGAKKLTKEQLDIINDIINQFNADNKD